MKILTYHVGWAAMPNKPIFKKNPLPEIQQLLNSKCAQIDFLSFPSSSLGMQTNTPKPEFGSEIKITRSFVKSWLEQQDVHVGHGCPTYGGAS